MGWADRIAIFIETLFRNHLVILASFFIVSELHAAKKFLRCLVPCLFCNPFIFLKTDDTWKMCPLAHDQHNYQNQNVLKSATYEKKKNWPLPLTPKSSDTQLEFYRPLLIWFPCHKVLFKVDILFLILIGPFSVKGSFFFSFWRPILNLRALFL